MRWLKNLLQCGCLVWEGRGPETPYVFATENLTKLFEGQRPLYCGLNLIIEEGSTVVIVGESGAGKSVFLSLLLGLTETTAGRIWYRLRKDAGPSRLHVDYPVHAATEEELAELRAQVGLVFQESSLFDWMTVEENIALPLTEHPEVLSDWFDEFRMHPENLAGLLEPAAAHLGGTLKEFLHQYRSHKARWTALAEELLSRRDERELSRELAQLITLVEIRRLQLPGGRGPNTVDDFLSSPPALAAWVRRCKRERIPPSLRVFRDRCEEAHEPLSSARRQIRESLGQTYCEVLLEAVLTTWGQRLDPLASRSDTAIRGAWPPAPESVLRQHLRSLRRTSGHSGGTDRVGRRITTEALQSILHREGVSLAGPPSVEALMNHFLETEKERPELAVRLITSCFGDSVPDPLLPLLTGYERYEKEVRAAFQELETRPRDQLVEEIQDAMLVHSLGAAMDPGDSRWSRSALVKVLRHDPVQLGELATELGEGSLPRSLVGLAGGYHDFRQAAFGAVEELLTSTSREELSSALIKAVVAARMVQVRLDVERDSNKLPSQLSGGMKTRVGIARTLALRPSVVLYDEPTAGLDPVLARSIGHEIALLQRSGVVRTTIVVTHDKELYWALRAGTPRTRMLYLHRCRFLDEEGKLVNDRLRPGDTPLPEDDQEPSPAGAPEWAGQERRDPMRFIQEFTEAFSSQDTRPGKET